MLPNAASVARFADLASAWALTYLVHSTLLLLAAWLLTSRRWMSDGAREIVWRAALVGGIATATVQTAVATEPLGGQLSLAPRTAPPTPAIRLAVRDAANAAAPHVVFMRASGTRWTPAVVIVWLTTAGLGLLWLALGHARTLRVLDDRTPLDDLPLVDQLDDLLADARVMRRVELTCSSHIASPVALSGAAICLPRRALLELSAPEQESMLAHEVAHLVRRDPQWLVAVRAIEMVLFFQPLNRLARRRLQETAEFLCDDWAVARTSRPVTLAKCLAAVAEWVGRAPRLDAQRLQPLSAMVDSGGSPLVRRVGRILGERRAPNVRTPRVAFTASACALVGLAGIAPRVSVGHATPVDRLLFVRSVVNPNGLPAGVMTRRDSAIIFETGRARISVEQLVRQGGAVAVGAIDGPVNLVYRRRVPVPSPDTGFAAARPTR
jgi:beta-lactamase regulating signal transducer with metallopeptidase domain